MGFNWANFQKPIVGLSPMADYTDLPFGLICKKFGAQVIFREMASADAIVHGNEKTLKMLRIDNKERPVVQQIFGRDPSIMAQAADIICETSRPDGLDINMGCPARKVINNFHGAALMKEPALARDIIIAVKSAVAVPVSVKTRLGWTSPDEILSFAKVVEEAGADLLTVHGRTKSQGYSGTADWEQIRKVKNTLRIPVFANGSIMAPADIEKCLKMTGADGVLIARGALGNPWIFARREKSTLSREELAEVILQHVRLHLAHYGDYGMVLFRKHLAHYLKGIEGCKQMKQRLLLMKTYEELEETLLNPKSK